jgi:hypothetical protein
MILTQTKLHDETCQKRTLATIATHDLDNIKSNLIYEAADPEQIQVIFFRSGNI